MLPPNPRNHGACPCVLAGARVWLTATVVTVGLASCLTLPYFARRLGTPRARRTVIAYEAFAALAVLGGLTIPGTAAGDAWAAALLLSWVGLGLALAWARALPCPDTCDCSCHVSRSADAVITMPAITVAPRSPVQEYRSRQRLPDAWGDDQPVTSPRSDRGTPPVTGTPAAPEPPYLPRDERVPDYPVPDYTPPEPEVSFVQDRPRPGARSPVQDNLPSSRPAPPGGSRRDVDPAPDTGFTVPPIADGAAGP